MSSTTGGQLRLRETKENRMLGPNLLGAQERAEPRAPARLPGRHHSVCAPTNPGPRPGQPRHTHTLRGTERAPWWAPAAAPRGPGPGHSPPASTGARLRHCPGPRAAAACRNRTSPPRPRPPRAPPPGRGARAAAGGERDRVRDRTRRRTRELAAPRAQPCCLADHVTRLVTWPCPL